MPDRYDDDRDDDRPRGRGRDRDDRPRRRDDDSDDDFDPRPRRAAEVPAKGGAAGLALSIIALVLGTLALLFSFIPCLGYLAIYPGVVAIILSGLGLFLSVRGKGLPATALAVSVLSVGIAYWQGTRAEKVATDLEKGLKQAGENVEKGLKQGAEELRKERERLEQERLAKEKADAEKKKKANPDD
jgi:hypothetical protein